MLNKGAIIWYCTGCKTKYYDKALCWITKGTENVAKCIQRQRFQQEHQDLLFRAGKIELGVSR